MVKSASKKAFTLVEVCLVMLVFAIAISTILAFFPVALRQANSAISDSVVTSFADYVLNALQANAGKLTWAEWSNDKEFKKAMIKDIKLNGGRASLDYEKVELLENYLGGSEDNNTSIKYSLDFYAPSESSRVKQITLYVTDNKHGSVKHGHAFVTHVVYLGKLD